MNMYMHRYMYIHIYGRVLPRQKVAEGQKCMDATLNLKGSGGMVPPENVYILGLKSRW